MISSLSAVAGSDRFQTFGGDHLALLVIVALIIVWFKKSSAQTPESLTLKFAERTLAILLLAHWPLKIGLDIFYGTQAGWQHALPMHLCDWAAVASAIALLNRNPLAIELAWFWGLGGTLQGLLTPALGYPFPHPFWFTFFILHGGVVIAAVQVVIGRNHPPARNSWLRAIIATEIYFASALTTNILLGTNFGFLAEKPSQPSLLDYFGEWPTYLVGLQIALFVVITLLWLPFQRKRPDTT